MALVIGLSGRIGSGKGTAAEHLKRKYHAEQFMYSGILADLLKRLHMPPTRENLQKLGHGLRESLGSDVLVEAMRGDLKAARSEMLLVDGVRYLNEAEMISSFPESFIIFIDAPLEVRYERARKRAEKGEGSLSLDQFRENESAATESELDKVRGMADYAVDNTGTVEQLLAQIDRIMKKKLASMK
jgi:dephospho-CoA kinase